MIEPQWNSRLELHTYSERGLAEFILGSESHPEFQDLCANIVKYFHLPENRGEIKANGLNGPAVYLSAGSCYVYCLVHGYEISQKLEDAVKVECFDKGYPEPPEITRYEAAQKEAVRDRELAELKSILAQVGQAQPVSTEKQGIIEGLSQNRARGGNQARTEYIQELAKVKGCRTAEEATNYVIAEVGRQIAAKGFAGPFVDYEDDFLCYESGEGGGKWVRIDILRSFRRFYKSGTPR